MLQISTGFKHLILGANSFESIFNGGAIKVFDGFRPTTADGEEPASMMGIISLNGGVWAPPDIGNGLHFYLTGPYVLKAPAEAWELYAQRSGIPTWGRLLPPTVDAGGVSYEAPRIDFSISAVAGDHAELTLATAVVQNGQHVPIDGFFFTFPPLLPAP